MPRRATLDNWTARPDEPVRLRDKFSAGAVLFPTVYGLDSVGKNSFEFVQQNTSTLGRVTREGLRLVADHAGSDDDRLATLDVMSSPRAVDFTTVLCFRPLNSGNDRMDVSMAGHQIQFQNASILNIGYQGLNGAYFIQQFSGFSNAQRLDKTFVFVISTNLAERRLIVSAFANGQKLTKLGDWGTAAAIGGGGNTLPYDFYPTLSSREFNNYYHTSAYVELWGNFNKVFIEQDEADAIAANPWQIFEPRRIWVPVSASAGSPLTEKQGEAWSPEFPSQPDVQTKKVVLDHRNPLSKHLVHAFIGGCNYDIVTGREYYGAKTSSPYFETLQEIEADAEQGKILPRNAGFGSPGNGIPGGVPPNYNEFTFIQRHKLLSSGTYVTSNLSGWSQSFSRSFGLGIRYDLANFFPNVRGTAFEHAVSLKDDKWHTLGVARGVDGIGRAWKDGVNVASGAVAALDDTNIPNFQYVHYQVDGPFSLLFDRELTAVEHASIHANPYQFFKLDERYEPIAENRRGPGRREVPFESQPQEEAELVDWVRQYLPAMVATPNCYTYAGGAEGNVEPKTEASPAGMAWSRTGAGNSARFFHRLAGKVQVSEASFLVHGFCPKTVNNTGSCHYLTLGSSSVRQEPYSGGAAIALSTYFHPDYTGSQQLVISGALKPGQPFTILFSFKRNGTIRATLNGELVAENAFADSDVSLDTFYEGIWKLSSSAERSGSMSLAAVFLKEVSVSDAKKITSNPWQLFKPKSKPVARVQAPAVIVPRRGKAEVPFDSQPQEEAEVDQTNHLTRGLVRAYYQGDRTTHAGKGYSVPTIVGPADDTPMENSTTLYSIVPNVAPAWNANQNLYNTSDSAWPNDKGLVVRSITAYGKVTVLAKATTNASRTVDVDVVDGLVVAGKQYNLGFTIDNSLFLRAFCDGLFKAESNSLQGYSYYAPNANSNAVMLPVQGGLNAVEDVSIIYLYRWNRVLSDEEIASVHRNPWQLFKPKQGWRPAGRAGILLPELSVSTYKEGSLSGTGWTPQIKGRI